MKSQQEVVRFLFKQVNKYNMVTVLRKILKGATAYIRRLRIIERRNGM